MNNEKIQKVLARAGVASRRMIEQWLQQGRIKVNGSLAKLGDRIASPDEVIVDGSCIDVWQKQSSRMLIYNKPAGEICSHNDPEGRLSVFDHLPELKVGRWLSVGRLDMDTHGLLLFTNNGEWAQQLMHPKAHIEREYAVRIYGDVTIVMTRQLTKGVILEDGFARFEDIQQVGDIKKNTWFHVVIMQGRNRIVRRLWESQGVTVSRLIRVRYGHLSLPRRLAQGEYQELPQQDIDQLLMGDQKKKTE